MPRVASFDLPGIDCRFYSNDHEPPHFHAKRKDEWEYRVFFLQPRKHMLKLKWAGSFREGSQDSSRRGGGASGGTDSGVGREGPVR